MSGPESSFREKRKKLRQQGEVIDPDDLAEQVDEVGALSNLYTCLRGALTLADRRGESFVFTFNQSPVLVRPGDNFDEVNQRYTENRIALQDERARGRFMEAAEQFADDPRGPEAIGKLVEAATSYRSNVKQVAESKARAGLD